jgi:hypothetical protein
MPAYKRFNKGKQQVGGKLYQPLKLFPIRKPRVKSIKVNEQKEVEQNEVEKIWKREE